MPKIPAQAEIRLPTGPGLCHQVDEKNKGAAPEHGVGRVVPTGEPSSHIWFVMRYVFGYRSAKNHNGVQTEWDKWCGRAQEATSLARSRLYCPRKGV